MVVVNSSACIAACASNTQASAQNSPLDTAQLCIVECAAGLHCRLQESHTEGPTYTKLLQPTQLHWVCSTTAASRPGNTRLQLNTLIMPWSATGITVQLSLTSECMVPWQHLTLALLAISSTACAVLLFLLCSISLDLFRTFTPKSL